MSAFPQMPSMPPYGGTSGGVPQYFGKGGAASWFPGAPQYDMTMSDMLQQYGATDPQLSSLMSGYDTYGNQLRKQAQATGIGQTTQARDTLAKTYGANPQEEALAAQGLQTGSDMGPGADYNAKMLGTTGIMAQAQRAKADVAGQIALQKQAISNAYKQNQLKQLSDMLGLASSAAQSQFGYQQAQMSADRGQIQLDNAQNAEQQSNMMGLMSMLFGNQMPSLFGSGPNSAFGGLSGGGGFLSSFLGSGAGAGGVGTSASAISNFADPLVMAGAA